MDFFDEKNVGGYLESVETRHISDRR